MHRILFQIGNITVYSYGICIALGLIAGMTLVYFRSLKFGLDGDRMFTSAIIAFIFGMIGAKLLYIITELNYYIENPKALLQFGSGFVVYGGLILGIAAFFMYFKIKKASALEYAEVAICGVSLGQAFGRVGCLMAGCCYGAPAPEGAWYGMTFPVGTEGVAGIPLYPTQVISVILNLVLCGILIWASYKEKFAGFALSLYLMLYSFGRFFVEFLRDDPRGSVGPFSTSQFIAIFVFAIGVALFFVFRWYGARPVRVGGYPEDEMMEELDAEMEAVVREEFTEIEEAVEETEEAAEEAEEAVEEAAETAEETAEEAVEEAVETVEEAAETVEEAEELMEEVSEEVLKEE